jgi:thiol-disulfide isomerase/thioredoxin
VRVGQSLASWDSVLKSAHVEHKKAYLQGVGNGVGGAGGDNVAGGEQLPQRGALEHLPHDPLLRSFHYYQLSVVLWKFRYSAMARTAASEAEVKAAVEQTSQRPSPSAPSLLLIDFFASWCGPWYEHPCLALLMRPRSKQIGPLVDKLSKDLRHEVAFLKVDVDALPQVAAQFGVKVISSRYILC